MSALTDLGNRIKAIYDRVIAFVVILALLFSLIYLAVQAGTMRGKLRQFDEDIKRMKPANENAEVVALSPYAEGQEQIRDPFQMSVDTNRYLLVPEKRVWCQGCTRPTPYDSVQCVFCSFTNTHGEIGGAAPPDVDEDGMDTKWEVENGFDPNDASDAELDADGDRFTNLQEYNAGTDPRNPDDHPPLLYQLRLVQIDKTPFKMVFVARQQMPGDKERLQINYGGRSYFCKVGEPVEGKAKLLRDPETGKLVNRRRVLFTVTEFREKYEERMNEAVQKVQKVDVSEIDLQPEGASKPVTLVYRKTRVTYRAVLELPIDNWKPALDQGALFNLRSEEFRVVEIEVEPGRALIMRTADKARFWVDGQGVTPVKDAPDADGDR